MSGLHVYTDDEEFVIASSEADAAAVLREASNAVDVAIWFQLPDDRAFTYDDGQSIVKKTCGEWAKERGRGYFCAANY